MSHFSYLYTYRIFDCEELAAIQNDIVLETRAYGCTMLGGVEVRWYTEDFEWEVDNNGMVHPFVVMREEWRSGKAHRHGAEKTFDDWDSTIPCPGR